MDFDIFVLLTQDGVISGAIYALVGVALVLIFALTRIIAVFLGEFVAYGALTFVALQADRVPQVIWLTLAGGVVAGGIALYRQRRQLAAGWVGRTAVGHLVLPAVVAMATLWLAPLDLPVGADIALTFLIVVPFAGYLYGIAFQPAVKASVLVLLIISMGVHLSLLGLGLVFFGADGLRASTVASGSLTMGAVRFSAQQMVILSAALVSMVALAIFFGRSFRGLALRATAVNRLGAQLVGIAPSLAGQLAFGIAASMAVLCGILISPVTTIYYDTGFTIALKGFVAAVIGALASYPATAIAALGVGVLESFASFFASQYKEVITFGLIVPALLVRSLLSREEEDDQ